MNSASNFTNEELDSDDEENTELLEFYRKHFLLLRTIPLSEIDPSILWTIASMLHSSSSDYGEQWREYGFSLGIKTHFELDDLKQKAGVNKVLPLYLALVWAIQQNKTFGKIIAFLMRKNKYHILLKLKPDIQTLLDTRSASTSCNTDTFSEDVLNESHNVYTDSSIETCHFQESRNSQKTSFGEKCIIEYDSKQNSSPFHNSARIRNSKLTELLDIDFNVQPTPSAPLRKQLSVLIMQTTEDDDKTSGLVRNLIEREINVVHLSDFESSLMNDSVRVLTYVFSQVDFIIPIVSLNLFRQIYPRDFEKHIDSEEAMNNSTLYNLLVNECRRNGWLKLRVRPMLVPGFDKRLLKNNLLFSSPLRLETEVPKLISVLNQIRPESNLFLV